MLDTTWPDSSAPVDPPDSESNPGLKDSEWRQVAILCLSLTDLALRDQDGDEEARAHLNNAAATLSEILTSFGSTPGAPVARPARGKGLLLTAVFGNQTATENDAERAVRAAIMLYDRLHVFNRELSRSKIHLEMQIGIHYGRVTTFADGSVEVLENAMSVARGLALAAPADHILITHEVHGLLADLFHYEGLGPIFLQGHSAPMPAYRVVGLNPRIEGRWQRSRLVRRAQMVGREEELETLQKIYAEAKDPATWKRVPSAGIPAVRPTIVAISGPAGSGKSRILYEFRRVTPPFREGTISPLVGRSASIFPVPYAIFVEMTRNLFGIRGIDPPMVRQRKLETGLAPLMELEPELNACLSILHYLVGGNQEQDPRQSAFEFQLELRTAFTRLLRAVARQSFEQRGEPLLIYLEDLHGIHERSQSALTSLLERLNSPVPLIIFATHRPGYRLPGELTRAASVIELPLKPLAQEAERALIASLLDGADLPPALEARVLEKAAGNPYYVEELIRALVEERVITYSRGTWQVEKAVEDVTLPSSLASLLLARIDTLERPARELLLRAAVVGELINPDVLYDLQLELQGPPIEPLLKQLEEARLLEPVEQGNELLYAFENPLVREVSYQTLVPHNRAVLHRLVARAIERRYAGSLADHYLELANHFRLGEEPGRAADYFQLAGEKAQREYANELALSSYTTYLNLRTDAGEARRVRWRLARVLRLLGRADEAAAVLEALSREVLADFDGATFLADVVLELARVRRNIGQLPEAVELSQRALELSRQAIDPARQAEALVALGKCWRLQGNLSGAREAYQEALVLLERLGDEAMAGRVYSNLGRIALDRRDLEEAGRLFARALERQRQAEDRWGIALELGHLGEVAYAGGDLETAEGYFRACLGQSEPLDIRSLMAGARMYLGAIAARRGERSGLEDLEAGIRIAAALQDLPRQVRGHQLKQEALEALELSSEAAEERQEAARLARLAGMA